MHIRTLISFNLTLVCSAILLFWLQLMYGKMVLPLFGGVPAVWTTMVMFFQALLLLGYSYVYVVTRAFSVRTQIVFQLALLLIAMLFFIPLMPPDSVLHTEQYPPVISLLLILFYTLGLPFFVISTASPLLSYWFANTKHKHAENPYFFYISSNIGSALGLICYPFLLEPWLSLQVQNEFWSIGFGLLLLSTFITAVFALVYAQNKKQQTSEKKAEITIPLRSKLLWIGLSFVPNSLMLALTFYITMDILSIPLLWMVPLMLYLLSFAVAFTDRFVKTKAILAKAQFSLLIPLMIFVVMDLGQLSGFAMLLWLMLALFSTAVVCHSRLYDSRPKAQKLPEFYLWVAFGGLVGGVFNGIVAPFLFDSLIELPVTIALAALLCAKGSKIEVKKDVLISVAFLIVLTALTFGAQKLGTLAGETFLFGCLLAMYLLALKFCFDREHLPLQFGLCVLFVFISSLVADKTLGRVLHQERSFFGMHYVETAQNDEIRRLLHGTTLHGLQLQSEDMKMVPTVYYHEEGPLGQAWKSLLPEEKPLKVAAIGLGVGTLSCLGSSNVDITFYEIDPAVIEIATNDNYFTFMRDCPPEKRVIEGDARLSMVESKDNNYDVIIVDAFSSDSVPAHLLTTQAISLYLSKMKPDGLMLFHVSNAFFDFKPVIGRLAHEHGLKGFNQIDTEHTEYSRKTMKQPSEWIVLSHSKDRLDALDKELWNALQTYQDHRLWTDDYTNIVGVIKF